MLKNMKIRARLFVSYLSVVLFMVIVGITALVMLKHVGSSLDSFYDYQFQTVDEAWMARRCTFSVQSYLQEAILSSDLTATQKSISSAKADFQEMKDAVAQLENTFQGDQNLLTTTTNLLNQLEPILNNTASYAAANQNDQAYSMLLNSFDPIADQIRSNLRTVGEQADSNALNRVTEGQSLTNIATLVIVALLIGAIVISVLLALIIAEGIRKPLLEIRRVSEDIVAGNLETKLEYQARDELGDLSDNIRQLTLSVHNIIQDIGYVMQEMSHGNFCVTSQNASGYQGDYRSIYNSMNMLRDTMNETLLQINQSSEQVSAGSDQVAAGAQALSQGAAEQASSVQELAATINDISTHIGQTAVHANTAKEENIHAHDEIQVCSDHMNKLVKAIEIINEKSNEISKIIKTIEDISFQTNILALNAAVEAARAGSAGKGFAVVADEVRNLASKSAEAAKSTTTLIEETIQAVAEGTKISAATEESLGNVVKDSQKVLDAVASIAQASNEQAEAVAQVTQGIDQISSVVQTNSATSEESAAASEELSGQAQMLKELVSRFKLRQEF